MRLLTRSDKRRARAPTTLTVVAHFLLLAPSLVISKSLSVNRRSAHMKLIFRSLLVSGTCEAKDLPSSRRRRSSVVLLLPTEPCSSSRPHVYFEYVLRRCVCDARAGDNWLLTTKLNRKQREDFEKWWKSAEG